jgi:hypothetical protein
LLSQPANWRSTGGYFEIADDNIYDTGRDCDKNLAHRVSSDYVMGCCLEIPVERRTPDIAKRASRNSPKCTKCGAIGDVDTRLDWSEVINFNKGIAEPLTLRPLQRPCGAALLDERFHETDHIGRCDTIPCERAFSAAILAPGQLWNMIRTTGTLN